MYSSVARQAWGCSVTLLPVTTSNTRYATSHWLQHGALLHNFSNKKAPSYIAGAFCL